MRVAELRFRLLKMPSDAEVQIYDGNYTETGEVSGLTYDQEDNRVIINAI